MPADRALAALKAALVVVVPGAGPAAELIKALLELAAARANQLNRVEQKIDDVRDTAFRRGQELLREARAIPTESSHTLALAVEEFARAHATYEREPELSWWAALYVAVLSYALGNNAKAKYWLPKAYSEAILAVNERSTKANDFAVGRVKVGYRQAAAGSNALQYLAPLAGTAGFIALAIFLLSSFRPFASLPLDLVVGMA